MFILTQPVNIYSVKLITDMVGRFAATETSVCPMFGFLKRLQDLWHVNETTADICALFEAQSDFDADKATPTVTLEDLEGREDADLRVLQQEGVVDYIYDPYIHKTNFDGYVRHLEDLPEGYMDKYLENITFRIRHHNNGVAAYNRKHPIQNNFIGIGDNGLEVTERVDLISDYSVDRATLQDTESARRELPYVVKRLHNLSRLTSIHILSFIASFVKAKTASDRARELGTSTSQFKLNDVIRAGMWRCDTNGDATKPVVLGDKNKSAPVVFQWACGYPSTFTSYYEDMVNFLTYCEVLSIDIINDDLTQYGSEFIKGILVTTVTSNTQYDKLVSDAIRYYGGTVAEDKSSLSDSKLSTQLAEVVSAYQNYYYSRTDEYAKYMNQTSEARLLRYVLRLCVPVRI